MISAIAQAVANILASGTSRWFDLLFALMARDHTALGEQQQMLTESLTLLLQYPPKLRSPLPLPFPHRIGPPALIGLCPTPRPDGR